MRKRKLRIGTIGIIGLAVIGLVVFLGKKYTFDFRRIGKDELFEINGRSCSLEEARVYMCNYKNLYGNAYGMDLWTYEFPNASLQDYVRDVTVDELAKIYCMDLLAKEQGVTLSDSEMEGVKEAAEEYYNSLSKEEIKFMAVHQSDIEEYYENYALATKLYAQLTNGVNDEVSDDEARIVRLQQIFVTNTASAEVVRNKILAGEDFSTIAAVYNEANSIEILASRSTYPKEVERVAFNLENGQISDGVPTEKGTYFLKCVNKYEEALTEANKGNILVQREKEQFSDVYNEFVANAKKSINHKMLDKLVIPDDNQITTSTFFSVYDKKNPIDE